MIFFSRKLFFPIPLQTLGKTSALIFFYPDLTLNGLVEGNLCLCLLHVRNLLNCVQEDFHKVVVVKAI